MGEPEDVAVSIMRALLSTIDWASAFSSRLFSRYRYRDSLIFCWRSMESIWRALAGIWVNCRMDSCSFSA